MLYTVFSHPICATYKSTVFSKASVFYVFSSLLTFIPPLLITYRSQGFWMFDAKYHEQPEVHFKHELLLLMDLDGDSDSYIGWSSYQNFNKLLEEKARVPMIKSREDDRNHDGKLDSLTLEVEMPLQSNENVLKVQAMLFFNVKLHHFSSVTFEGMVYKEVSSVLPGSSFDVIGDLSFMQRDLLAHKGIDNRFADPIVNSTGFAQAFDFAHIVASYSERNLTVHLQNDYQIWHRGASKMDVFTARFRIKYPEQAIRYRPGFWQVMKWAWVQYLSVLIVFVYIFRRIKTYVFSMQVLPTRPIAPHLKQF